MPDAAPDLSTGATVLAAAAANGKDDLDSLARPDRAVRRVKEPDVR